MLKQYIFTISEWLQVMNSCESKITYSRRLVVTFLHLMARNKIFTFSFLGNLA